MGPPVSSSNRAPPSCLETPSYRWRWGLQSLHPSLVQCAVPLPVGPEPRRAAVAGVVPLASWRAGVLVPVRHRRGHDEVARSLGLSEVEYDFD